MTVDQISTQIVDAITKYSPQALEVAKSVERINALDWLLTDLAWLGVGAVLFGVGCMFWKRSDPQTDFQRPGSGIVIAAGPTKKGPKVWKIASRS